MLEHVHWLGHSSVKITGSKIVYVDPFEISGGETADLILITHEHHDHKSLEDIRKIQGEKTVIVVPKGSEADLRGNIRTVRPGEKLTVQGVDIEAVPAYNIGKRFHPKEKGYVAYVFKVDGIAYLHAGDTDAVPELKSVKTDVAFLPVGGTYTMTAKEAAALADIIRPKVTVPIHWGSVVGSEADAQTFKKLCKCEVRILKHE